MDLDFEIKPSGLIKSPIIVMLPNGPDHKNWIEVGEEEQRGLNICIVAYNPTFGHLWRSGYITREELEKARKGEKFQWLNSGISGHGHP